VNLYFLQGISWKLKRGIKTSQGIKLNSYKNYSRRLQRTSGDNPRGRALEATRWDQLAPSWCHPSPGSGPHLSASGMFLHRLPRLHLCHSSSWFDPRAHVGPCIRYTDKTRVSQFEQRSMVISITTINISLSILSVLATFPGNRARNAY
jgi:hypothetical protein